MLLRMASWLRPPTSPALSAKSTGDDIADSHPVLHILATRCFFARLALPRCKATPADVRKQYRQRALLCHPDKSTHPRAKDAFQSLSEAFECLYDERLQAAYLSRTSGVGAGAGKKKRKGGPDETGSGTGAETWYARARSWADIERELQRREEAERRLRAKFVSTMSSRFADHESERLLQRAQGICRTLDERAGNGPNPMWAVLVQRELVAQAEAMLPDGWEIRRSASEGTYYHCASSGITTFAHPDQKVEAARAALSDVHDFQQEPVLEKLRTLLDYLRDVHDFCDLEDDYVELTGGVGDAGKREEGQLGEGEYDY